MPIISKFDGYLVKPEHVQNVVTPAYDAMLPSERREFAEEYPGNYVNVMRTLEEFPDSPPHPNTPNLSLIHISEPTRPY